MKGKVSQEEVSQGFTRKISHREGTLNFICFTNIKKQMMDLFFVNNQVYFLPSQILCLAIHHITSAVNQIKCCNGETRRKVSFIRFYTIYIVSVEARFATGANKRSFLSCSKYICGQQSSI